MLRPRVLVAVSDGSEEIEAVAVIDVLRRAEVAVTVARVPSAAGAGQEVLASRGVRLGTDRPIAACTAESWDAIVLPGGMPGAEHLRDDTDLLGLLRRQVAERRLVAAICAAPAVVLAHHGLLHGRQATCFPGMRHLLPVGSRNDGRVVIDGGLVTSQGPGTALEFAVVLVGLLCGDEVRERVAAGLLLR
ncbi:MAG TPA: DJ-1/PfpI family protein [Candidatus Krumholzibacteria bacterium]|nr:DJ-1/PfpI family protein [Candidatus Krumholzibacteria bacterium]